MLWPRSSGAFTYMSTPPDTNALPPMSASSSTLSDFFSGPVTFSRAAVSPSACATRSLTAFNRPTLESVAPVTESMPRDWYSTTSWGIVS